MKQSTFTNYFLNVPISINNLYGDPFFPTQIENTFSKLDALAGQNGEPKHQGIISIITKTEINEDIATRLQKYRKDKHLNIIILVSISSLSYEIEKIKGNRYNTLKICKQFDIPCLAYVRPFIPGENTNKETVYSMFENIIAAGVDTIVVSGLRGNDDILKNVGINDEEMQKWSLRVKKMPPDVRGWIEDIKRQYPVHVFERTSCGVSYVLGKTTSYNPYYASPQLAKCFDCPNHDTCFLHQDNFYPTKEDIELVHLLGYKGKRVDEGCYELCQVDPAKRTECISCCTSCFKLKRDAIELEHFDGLCLGDIGLLRLLINKLVYCKGIIDSGDPSVARPKNPLLTDENVYILNSWWSYSRNTSNCYQCSYCIVPTYKNADKEYGDTPYRVMLRLLDKIKANGGTFDEE